MSNIVVYVDSRESRSGEEVVKWLKRFGCVVVEKNLEIGDYQVSKDVIIERKKAMDFINSIIDGRLFEQCKKLVNYCKNPYVIVEGNLWYCVRKRNIHHHSVIGALTTITELGINILHTPDEEGTAYTIYSLAKHEIEHGKGIKSISVRKSISIRELQIQFVSSLPGIGKKRAIRILKTFNTPLEAINNFNQWRKADIPENVIALIRKVLTTKFTESEQIKQEILIDELLRQYSSESNENKEDNESHGILKFI